jgi:hypothetical protein
MAELRVIADRNAPDLVDGPWPAPRGVHAAREVTGAAYRKVRVGRASTGVKDKLAEGTQ